MKKFFRFPVRKGFTFLEVMVSVAILSTLMISLIKTQSENTLLLSFSKRYEQASKHVRSELQKAQRENKQLGISINEGTFKEDEPMFGFTWSKEISEEELFTIPMFKISYAVFWEDGLRNNSYEASIYVRKKF